MQWFSTDAGLGLRSVVLLCLMVTPASSHPQCLDFKPPFKAHKQLEFCAMYKDFGCCDYHRDQQLMTEFYRIMNNFDYYGHANCAGFVMELLCQVRNARTRDQRSLLGFDQSCYRKHQLCKNYFSFFN